MIDGKVRESMFQMYQALTTQAQDITAQANRDGIPLENQHASTMASCLRGFSRINPPMFIGSKVDEDQQDFLDGVYKILSCYGGE